MEPRGHHIKTIPLLMVQHKRPYVRQRAQGYFYVAVVRVVEDLLYQELEKLSLFRGLQFLEDLSEGCEILVSVR